MQAFWTVDRGICQVARFANFKDNRNEGSKIVFGNASALEWPSHNRVNLIKYTLSWEWTRVADFRAERIIHCNLPSFRFSLARQLFLLARPTFSYTSAWYKFLVHSSEARSIVNTISNQHVYKEGCLFFFKPPMSSMKAPPVYRTRIFRTAPDERLRRGRDPAWGRAGSQMGYISAHCRARTWSGG